MVFEKRKALLMLTLTIMSMSFVRPVFSKETESLLFAGPNVRAYATQIVKPVLDSSPGSSTLSIFQKISDILLDPTNGIGVNKLEPTDFFIYDILDKLKLGFLFALKFPSVKRQILLRWHDRYMQKNRADVFFAPSADEIIRSKAAFGCTHYARAFIAVVKALGLVKTPENLRYVISCKADDYNRAMETKDLEQTINGHQFVLARIDSGWVAINTSKGGSVAMPQDFSPDSYGPPQNIHIRFESYPGIVFLIRKIGADFNDDCGDDSLSALMNISRSGDSQQFDFLWRNYVPDE